MKYINILLLFHLITRTVIVSHIYIYVELYLVKYLRVFEVPV